MANEYSPYEELRNALALMPDGERVREALNRTYRRFLDNRTQGVNISLVGPFAQTDYLLKEHKASAELRRWVNDVRVSLKQTVADEATTLTDAEGLARFIALITDEAIPEDIALLFPQRERQQRAAHGLVLAQQVRFILDAWDEQYLYGRIEGDESAENQRVRYGDDYAYLRSMLYANAQFNLIRPRFVGDTIRAELIILEPDYLVGISDIARCFESYDESPYVYLINKLKPNTSTEYTLLGNFAGQLLDEEVHAKESSYRDSAVTFFHQNAIGMLTTPLSADFHKNAQVQQSNIRRAITEVLPEEVGAFRKEDVLLEPSFFSEMLGLSGRMDLLQHDMKVLIEQKSGKAAFIVNDPDPDTPKPNEPNYVQMLLYMLLVRYNYPEQYKQGTEGIQAFLMYSKYKNSLVKLDFAPELVRRAIRIRNGIAWMEGQLGAAHGTHWDWQRLILPLSPDVLNTKHCAGRLWTVYKKPELESILAPIHNASPLERAYFFRFMDFLSREHLLQKVGNKTRQNAGFAAKWQDSLAEKRQAGNIYDALSLKSVSPLTFTFTETANNDIANFRIGDGIVLYPYPEGQEPDVRKTMVHRATIEDITAETIVLHLRAEQSDPMVFLRHEREHWAIEHDFMDSSFSSLYSGMHAFLSASQDRRDLLMMQRQPALDDSVLPLGEYGAFNELMLRVKRAKDFFLIIGPPGTGKTSFGMLNTLKEELLEKDSRVLVLSYTNRAVDEICSKLLEEDIDFVRIGNKLSCAPEFRERLLSERCEECSSLEQVRHIFTQTRVVCSTSSSVASRTDLLKLQPFTLCIIDEASQILEPHLVGILSALTCRFVMIGDHKQLPAVVQQTADESAINGETEEGRMLQSIGLTNCRLSLFERLLTRYRDNRDVVYMLTKQGRMHHDIADFPNRCFYDGRLTEVPLPHQIAATPQRTKENADKDAPFTLREVLTSTRLAFIDVPRPKSSISDKVNQAEADIIAQAVAEICRIEGPDFDAESGIGIIVPYRNQIATVRNTIEKLSVYSQDPTQWDDAQLQQNVTKLRNITIDTVERFQGSQRRYIIYGFTVQQPYQLDFLTDNTFEEDGHLIDRKLNVAMTRAKEHMLLVGNQSLLSRVPVFKQLIDSYLVNV